MNIYRIAVIPGDGIGVEVMCVSARLEAFPAGALMLEFLGEVQASNLVLSSIKPVTTRGNPLTRDIGGNASTIQERYVTEYHPCLLSNSTIV